LGINPNVDSFIFFHNQPDLYIKFVYNLRYNKTSRQPESAAVELQVKTESSASRSHVGMACNSTQAQELLPQRTREWLGQQQ